LLKQQEQKELLQQQEQHMWTQRHVSQHIEHVCSSQEQMKLYAKIQEKQLKQLRQESSNFAIEGLKLHYSQEIQKLIEQQKVLQAQLMILKTIPTEMSDKDMNLITSPFSSPTSTNSNSMNFHGNVTTTSSSTLRPSNPGGSIPIVNSPR